MHNSGKTLIFVSHAGVAERIDRSLHMLSSPPTILDVQLAEDDRICHSIASLFIVDITRPVTHSSDTNAQAAANPNSNLIDTLLRLAENNTVVFIGHSVSTMSVVDWMRRGLYSYLDNDASQTHFDVTLQAAAATMLDQLQSYRRYCQLQQRFAQLSDAESEVLDSILRGDPNKAIAKELGVSQRAIESRRQKLYAKLSARTVVDVVKAVNEFDQLRHRYFRVDSPQLIARNHITQPFQRPRMQDHLPPNEGQAPMA